MADDRFRVGNRRDNMRRRIDKWRAAEEKKAEAQNEKGKYLCADCDKYYPLVFFEYEYKGETKIARRCEGCRDYRRKHGGRSAYG